MSKTPRTARSFLKSLSARTRDGRSKPRAADLAARAGRCEHGTPFEGLEERRLLFTATIGPGDIDPATGLGTISDSFAYFIPFILAPDVETEQPDDILEEFGDEDGDWTELDPAVVPNGTVFSQSNILLNYASGSAAPVVLQPGADPGQTDDQDLRVTLEGNDQALLSFLQGTDQVVLPRRILRAVLTINPALADGNGLNTDPLLGTRVELLRDGEVVAEFSGATLAALGFATGGGARQYTFTIPDGFEAIRFRSAADAPDNASYFDQFVVDDIQLTPPPTTFTEFLQQRVRGAFWVLTGPVGTTLEMFDLYDRHIRSSNAVGMVPGADVVLGDPDGDGVPNFNDGIGRITITGGDGRASLTLLGGPAPTFVEEQGGFVPQLTETPIGIIDGFTQGGFGYTTTPGPNPQPTGLPTGGGSVIVGAPWVRDLNDYYAPVGDATAQGMNRSDQGVFHTGGGTWGSVYIHGILHGSSQFSGALGQLVTGPLMGSVRVQGDLGLLSVHGEAGVWADPLSQSQPPTAAFSTNNQLIVGRTVREITITGRSTMDIQVLGDINNRNRPRLRFAQYNEREFVYGFAGEVAATMSRTLEGSYSDGEQAITYGTGFFRNDLLSGAEFIGHAGTSVRVSGSLGAADPVNSEDPSDVFAFAADPTREVVLYFPSDQVTPSYVRIVDRNGRVLAAIDDGAGEPTNPGYTHGPGMNTVRDRVIRFRPDHADVYYIVLNEAIRGTPAADRSYNFVLSGMAPTLMGQFRTGAGLGGLGNDPPTITLGAGSLGAFRVGDGWVTPESGQASGAELGFSADPVEVTLAWRRSTLSVPGTLFAASAGTSLGLFRAPYIDAVTISVGDNLGSLTTGSNPAAAQGDLVQVNLGVGGTIGLIEVAGAAGTDRAGSRGGVSIRTGTSPGARGDIGRIVIGEYVDGSAFSLTTSPGSVIDQFLVEGRSGAGEFRGDNPAIVMGSGSDLRFVDFTGIARPGDPDVVTSELRLGESVTLTDDAGGEVTITLSGDPNAPNAGDSRVTIRTLRVDGSQGSAIGRIQATLRGGADLIITGTGEGVVSIGRIIVLADDASDAFAPSDVLITTGRNVGAEIDVGRIDVQAGVLGSIRNESLRGDIVAIDAAGLRTLTITGGDLGRTQVSGAGPSRLGPFLGITAERVAGQIGGPLGIDRQSFTPLGGAEVWNGEIFTPINVTDFGSPSFLEDLGSPIDGYLDGVVVRTGDLRSVSVAGAVGDVLVEAGDLISLTANADGQTSLGGFDGIVGSVYAVTIGTIDVGDGIEGTGPSPFARAGVFADDDIVQVFATRSGNTRISGAIIAANIDTEEDRTTIGTEEPADLPAGLQFAGGLGQVSIANGLVDGALFHAGSIDDFWQGVRTSDGPVRSGRIVLISLTDADLFRSSIEARSIGDVVVTRGVWDATRLNAAGAIGTIRAEEFRNSTLLGAGDEVFANEILASSNVGSIIATRADGDIADLRVLIVGNLTGQIAARDIVRSTFDIASRVQRVAASRDISASTFTTGRLVALSAGSDIRSTTFNVAGPIESITAAGEMTNLDVNSTGPDGRVDLIRSGGRMAADISSSGRIGTIESTGSDVEAVIVTTDTDGSLALLRAANDLLVDVTILGDAQSIVAGRNIGRAGDRTDRALDIRGDLGSVTAENGQIYNDIRVSGDITGTIRNARVVGKPGNDQVADRDIVAFGRINAVDLNGDFNGDIISHSGGIGAVTITRGSFRPGNVIAAYDGDIGTVTIRGGDLLGNIETDGSIGLIEVLAFEGYKGQIGIATGQRSTKRVDAFRNQLPPGVAKTSGVDGPTIRAGHDIGRVFVQRGSLWETTIIAGRSIGTIQVRNAIRNDNLTLGTGSYIIAGERIGSVSAGANVTDLLVAAGIVDLGSDGLVGGTGDAADVVASGDVGQISFTGKQTRRVHVSAGIAAGEDGVYGGTDDRQVSGVGTVGSVTARNPRDVSVFADAGVGPVTRGVQVRRNGRNLRPVDATRVIPPRAEGTRLVSGQSRTFVTGEGYTIRVTFTGQGRAYWDRDDTMIRLIGTTEQSSLLVEGLRNGQPSAAVALRNLQIRGNNNASLGSLDVQGQMTGNASAFLDGNVGQMVFKRVASTGLFGAGGDIGSATFFRFLRGRFEGREVGTLDFRSHYGVANREGEASASVLDLGTLNAGSRVSAPISSDRDIDAVNVTRIDRGGVRAGDSIGRVEVGSMNLGRISARNTIQSINIRDDATRSSLYVGTDLGRDADFGGAGLNADTITDGSMGPVTVGGDFFASDIAAGVTRGPDGFLGTADDVADDGRSSIQTVTIAGDQVGSLINSEQYRIVSTGTIGRVTVAGQTLASRGNFRVDGVQALPVPVVVTDTRVVESSRVYTAEVVFNQPIQQSTLAPSLLVQEVRPGPTLITLTEGVDYTVSYDAANNTARIVFSRTITERDLPQQPGQAGPGVYRITVRASTLRGESESVLLDGNSDGAAGDDFSGHVVVGDAGDKIDPGNPAADPDIDFYGAADLDVALDSVSNPDGLPEINRTFVIRGTIGDHPDASTSLFRPSSDVDVYRITLRAGQILRLGAVGGVATSLTPVILDSDGQEEGVRSLGNDYLVLETGTYFIVMAAVEDFDITDTNNVVSGNPAPGTLGAYSFTLQVFDDGDTGFLGDTDSGTGAPIVYAPTPIAFAGPDAEFGTADDVSSFVTRGFTFTLNRGPDGRPNTADDVVSGTAAGGFYSERTAGADRVFGTADDRVFSTVATAIGPRGGSGAPGESTPDIDVFHLNGGEVIAPGTRVRITIRLTETGSSLGSANIGLFEVPVGAGLSDALLVASPSTFLATGGTAGQTVSDGTTTYGYDNRGDFFMDFVVPGSQTVTGINLPAAYALYLEGTNRADYTLEVLQQGTGTVARSRQNVLLETLGGTIEWLEAGNNTDILPFNAAVLGFTGQIDGVDVGTYVLSSVVSALNALFAAANADIEVRTSTAQFTTNPGTFSTVFLAGNTEPNAFVGSGTYGASERVDMFNADKTDQAVVFIPSLGEFGFDPGREGVDLFVQALTAAVARRIGELVGLRLEQAVGTSGSPVPVMASDSVAQVPGSTGVYRFVNETRPLEGFSLGSQNSLNLLNRIITPRA